MNTFIGALKSKTIWAQVLQFAAMGLTFIGFDFTPEMQATILAAIVAVGAAVDIILRAVTNKSLADK
jgi:hypothetical protein